MNSYKLQSFFKCIQCHKTFLTEGDLKKHLWNLYIFTNYVLCSIFCYCYVPLFTILIGHNFPSSQPTYWVTCYWSISHKNNFPTHLFPQFIFHHQTLTISSIMQIISLIIRIMVNIHVNLALINFVNLVYILFRPEDVWNLDQMKMFVSLNKMITI